MREDLYWTDLSLAQISEELIAMETPVSSPTVKRLLNEYDFSKRKILKTLHGGHTPNRNAQFEHIARLQKNYLSQANPVFSIDTKKKELLGLLYRDGRRFFSHVTRACQGILFNSLDTVVNLMRKTATSTGLTATVRVMRKAYETGRSATQAFRDAINFKFDKVLPQWNYTATPQQ